MKIRAESYLAGISESSPILAVIDMERRAGHWGEDEDARLATEPYDFLKEFGEINGIEPSITQHVGWLLQNHVSDIVFKKLKNQFPYLVEELGGEVGIGYLLKIVKTLRQGFQVPLERALDELAMNPYLLVFGCEGFPSPTYVFKQISHYAYDEMSAKHPNRIRAAALAFIMEEVERGNSIIEVGVFAKGKEPEEVKDLPAGTQPGWLARRVAEIVGIPVDDILKMLIENPRILFPGQSETLTIPPHLRLRTSMIHGRYCVRPDWVIGMEIHMFRALEELLQRPEQLPPAGWNAWMAQFTTDVLSLDKDQQPAVEQVWRSPFSMITGGGGTGKTSIMRALPASVEAFAPQMSVLGIAPTNQAARRLKQATGIETKTVHSAFALFSDNAPLRKNRLEELLPDGGFLIVEESSMLHFPLMHAILQFALARPDVHIVLIGDAQQLEPVGIGEPFKVLTRYQVFPMRTLKKVYRSEYPGILALASWLMDPAKRGFVPQSPEVSYIPFDKDVVADDVQGWVKAHGGLENPQMQVICPYNKEVVGNYERASDHVLGVQELNALLRGGRPLWSAGERVVQTVNDYDHERYNGMTGVILASNEDRIIVDFEGVEHNIPMPIARLEIQTAWAMSVHKSQGSEWDHVLVLLPPRHDGSANFPRMEMLYTAVTRARKSLTILCPNGDLMMQAFRDAPRRPRVGRDLWSGRVAASYRKKEKAIAVAAPAATIRF